MNEIRAMETIRGIEAIQTMRNMRYSGVHFTMHHLTWSETRQKTNGLRVVSKARLRPALPQEFSDNINPDELLPYYDIENEKDGMCHKVLIRKVAFPPDYKLKQVIWHEYN